MSTTAASRSSGEAAAVPAPTDVGRPPRATYKAPPPTHLAHLGGSQQVAPLVDHSKPPSRYAVSVDSDHSSAKSRASSGDR